MLGPSELSPDWDPATNPPLTAWETVHHLSPAMAPSIADPGAWAALKEQQR